MGLMSSQGERISLTRKAGEGLVLEPKSCVGERPLYQDWDSGVWAGPPSPLPAPHGIQNGSSLCFRKFRPFHHQFKSFPEVSFLGPKDASPFEAAMTPGSSHHTRWVLLV